MKTIADVVAACQASFILFAANCLKIKTKEGRLVPFVLNEPQKILLEKIIWQLHTQGYVRIVILKGRQMGISTFIAAFLYWLTSTRMGRRTVVVAHKAEASTALFTMTKRYYQLSPEWIRPHTVAKSKKELDFDLLQSSYLVVTAGGDEIGRSETIQLAHLSEVAFWPEATAEANYTALMQTLPAPGSPEARGTVAFSESTANGVSGVFYNQWQQAEAGKNGWLPVFLCWTLIPSYTAPVPDDFQLEPDEVELVEKYGLTPGQVMFRRMKVADGGLDKFRQEYPLCAEEAFITSGSPVFSPEQLLKLEKRDQSSRFRSYEWLGQEAGFLETMRGDLKVWEAPEKGRRYYVGADVGGGIRGRDYSVAIVMDDTRSVVAMYRGYTPPEEYAYILQRIALDYNEADLIVENNNHGILPCKILGKDLAYPKMYLEIVQNTIDDTERTVIGWRTTGKSKPLIIDELRSEVSTGNITIRAMEIFRELKAYVVKKNGALGAESGKDADGEMWHDDCVMALALANHICEETFTPVDMKDEYYATEETEWPRF